MPESAIDLLRLVRGEIRFESEMLSSRPSAFLTSQSFLLIAYASGMGASHERWPAAFTLTFPLPLALLGLALSLQAWPGIAAASAVIWNWHAEQERLLSGSAELAAERGAFAASAGGAGGDRRLRQGTVFAKQTPWIFAVAWAYLAVLPAVLYWRG